MKNIEEVNSIILDIKARKLKPIYFLMGEEAFYIDFIADYLENNVLTEDEKAFNQVVLYGLDVSVDAIISQAKRYPMMADYQVVIVKEAQSLSRYIDALEAYAKNPQPSTILVICYKYKKIDKRKGLYKALAKTGLVYESQKIFEDKVADWIRRVVLGKNFKMEPKAAHMLVEFLGNDLGKINNELDKLMMVKKDGNTITAQDVEINIGVSKDYNNFELRKAIGEKDALKVFRIAKYFGENTKDNPLVLTIGLLFSYFQNLLIYHGLPVKDKSTVASALKINPYFVNEYTQAARNYPMRQVSHIINLLREADMKSKGVGASSVSQRDMLNELLVKIMS